MNLIFSLLRLILSNYLAQQGKTAVDKIKAALIISVPLNVFEATKSIEKPYLNLMLNKHLAGNLCRTIEAYHKSENGFWDIDIHNVLKVQLARSITTTIGRRGRSNCLLSRQSKTVREFDANFTAKQFGYKDVEDYYRNATVHDKLHLVEVPLLCLSAADDPFQPLDGNNNCLSTS